MLSYKFITLMHCKAKANLKKPYKISRILKILLRDLFGCKTLKSPGRAIEALGLTGLGKVQ